MISRLVRVARRQVRRSARQFQTAIPNASLLYVNPFRGCENTCGVHRDTLEGLAIKYEFREVNVVIRGCPLHRRMNAEAMLSKILTRADNIIQSLPVSYTHLRAHET